MLYFNIFFNFYDLGGSAKGLCFDSVKLDGSLAEGGINSGGFFLKARRYKKYIVATHFLLY
jgi:hypothetical protein